MGLLSLLVAGLGQFAYGRRRRAISFFVLDVAVLVAAIELAIHVREEPANLFVAGGLFGAWRLFAMVDAFRVRGETRGNLLLGLLAAVVVCGAAGFAAFTWALRPLRMADEGLEGTVAEGEVFLVDRLAYVFGDPARGDIVVYREEGGVRAKRIVGLAGEEIRIRDSRVFVDGTELDEPWATGEDPRGRKAGPVEVPEGHYYVLRDNRAAWRDNPDVVARDRILGRVALIVSGRPGVRIAR